MWRQDRIPIPSIYTVFESSRKGSQVSRSATRNMHFAREEVHRIMTEITVKNRGKRRCPRTRLCLIFVLDEKTWSMFSEAICDELDSKMMPQSSRRVQKRHRDVESEKQLRSELEIHFSAASAASKCTPTPPGLANASFGVSDSSRTGSLPAHRPFWSLSLRISLVRVKLFRT